MKTTDNPKILDIHMSVLQVLMKDIKEMRENNKATVEYDPSNLTDIQDAMQTLSFEEEIYRLVEDLYEASCGLYDYIKLV